MNFFVNVDIDKLSNNKFFNFNHLDVFSYKIVNPSTPINTT